MVEHDGAYTDKTGAVRTLVEFNPTPLAETTARCAGVLGVVSIGMTMIAGFACAAGETQPITLGVCSSA